MFEHGYRGIHAQYHRYPYGPYGVFKARFLECFGGLETSETLRFLAAPMKWIFVGVVRSVTQVRRVLESTGEVDRVL